MTDKEAKAVAELACQLLNASACTKHPNVAAQAAVDFVKAARTLHKLAEHECNRSLTDREARLQDRTIAKVKGWAESWGVTVKIEGDPRGFVLYLHGLMVNGRPQYNTWGGAESGYGVGA